MRSTDQQIDLARSFKAQGLAWEPAVGQYVYDGTHFLKPSSPFQKHVYFLLNYDCFMEKVGGVARFKELMTWLPVWEDARTILRRLGVEDAQVEQALSRQNAFANGSELSVLYQMIDDEIGQSVSSPNT